MIADSDHLAAVPQQVHDAGVIEGARTVLHSVLDVGEDQAVWVDTPLLHGHRADDVGRKARLGLPRLVRRQPDMRMSVLQRLKSVVDLHRRLHPFDVVLVMREDRDDEDDPVDHVLRDGHDVARVLRR